MLAVAVGGISAIFGNDKGDSTKKGGGAGIIGTAIDWLSELFGIELTLNDILIYAGLILVFAYLLNRANNMNNNPPYVLKVET